MSYNPVPPRVWSRVQGECTYLNPNERIPVEALRQLYKGNVLQHKANSACLTKSQKYSLLARMAGPSRTKVFATQTQTYTNPNTASMLRAGFAVYPFPNQIVGAPNNPSGPFAYGMPNPFDCSSNAILDGGILVCGSYANPCTNQLIRQGNTNPISCNSASASDVPGQAILCWDNRFQSWFPKPRYTMNNSTDKWPINYKGFVSAVDLSGCRIRL